MSKEIQTAEALDKITKHEHTYYQTGWSKCDQLVFNQFIETLPVDEKKEIIDKGFDDLKLVRSRQPKRGFFSLTDRVSNYLIGKFVHEKSGLFIDDSMKKNLNEIEFEQRKDYKHKIAILERWTES